MTSPGEGFQYDGDKVSARLSVDIPQDAIRSLDDVAQRTEDLRVNMEAVAKATADYSDYMQSIPALGQEAESRQGAFIQRNVDRLVNYEPSGLPEWQQSQSNQQLETLANNDPRQFANVMAQRGQDPDMSDMGRVLDRGEGPMPAPRSRRSSGEPNRGPSRGSDSGPSNRDDISGPNRSSADVDWLDVIRENQDRTVGTITSVLGELSIGGRANALQTTSNIAQRLTPGIQGFQGKMDQATAEAQAENESMIAQYAQENGVSVEEASEALRGAGALRNVAGSSLMSGASGMLLRGAGVAGIAAAGFAGIQQGGETIQGFRNKGAVRGGGATEGLQFEMGVRSLAMNPFIDVEQSRKIMQTALNEGFTGTEMETVTQFMTENLKQMNMTAQESAKVLQENVIKGGQDMAEAQRDAMGAGLMSQNEDSMKTSDEFRGDWQSATSTAISAGADGSAASSLGMLSSSMFSENSVLSDLSSQIVPGMTQNMSMGMSIGREVGYRGNPLGALEYALNQEGGDKTVMLVWARQITEIAQRVAPMVQNEQTKYSGIEMFRAQVKSRTGVNLEDHRQAEELFHMAAEGKLVEEVERSVGEREEALGGGEVTQNNLATATGSALAGAGNALKYGASATMAGVAGLLGMDEKAAKFTQDRDDAYGAVRRNNEGSRPGAWSNERIDQLISEYGASNLRVRDKQGNVRDFKNSDMEMMQGIASGDLEVSGNGGDFQKLRDMSLQQAAEQADVGGSGGKFDLTEDARKLLTLIPDDHRTQHQRNSDSNVQGANSNRPPVGEGFGVGGR